MKYFKNCPMCKGSLKWKTPEGVKRLVCPECGWINYLNPIPAVACVVKDESGGVLMVKRAVAPQIGKWSLPSGFMELYEEPEKAVLRELEEETGLKGKIIRLIGVYSQSSKEYGTVLTVGYAVKAIGGQLRAGDDASDAGFKKVPAVSKIPFKSHRNMLIGEGFK
jgi:ADP-ribose pyrophosphatase YjhB (NUDIX family)